MILGQLDPTALSPAMMMLRKAVLRASKSALSSHRRSLATRANAGSSSEAAKCPITGANHSRGHSSAAAVATTTSGTNSDPILQDVPAIPVLGSFVHSNS